MLKINDKPVNFKLPDQFGNEIELSDFLGKKMIIYFYPKDNTSGCTIQACSFKDNFEKLQKLGYVVIGISKDSVDSHIKFSSKYELPQILLSDESLEVIRYFGVWQEKKMYGKSYMGIVRTTFVLNEEGIISHVLEKVSPKNGLEQLLKLIS